MERPSAMAGAALVAAGAITAIPVVSTPAASHLVDTATRLTAGESLLNVPLNLLQDIANVPANEIYAMGTLAKSLLYSGPWFVGSPTNVWGEDPGDLGHFESVMEMMVPFPELSGAGHEGDFMYPGLGQELAMLAAVEIPANSGCESLDCLPVMPTSPITGVTFFDQVIWYMLIATGIQKFPLINDWFQVPFSDITNGKGYYFDPTAPGSQDTGVANDGFGWIGTHHPSAEELAQNPGLSPDANLMPWAGEHFKMDFSAPFQNFFNSLEEPFDPSKFEMPDPTEFLRMLQADVASLMVAFNPFVPGSPFCPGPCLLPDGAGHDEPTYYFLIDAINKLWPGNKILGEWLDDYHDGSANVSTPEFIDTESWLWRLGQTMFDFGNPMPDDPAIDTSGFLPTLDQIHGFLGDYLFNIADTSGFLGPFDMQGLWDAVFNIPDTTDATTGVAEATTGVTDALAGLL